MLLTHLNSSVRSLSLHADLYKGFSLSSISTWPSEFAHSSSMWQNNVRVGAGVGESLVWCLWSGGTAWNWLRTGQPRLEHTILQPRSTSPGVWKAQLLELPTHLTNWLDTAFRIVICQPVTISQKSNKYCWGSLVECFIECFMCEILGLWVRQHEGGKHTNTVLKDSAVSIGSDSNRM